MISFRAKIRRLVGGRPEWQPAEVEADDFLGALRLLRPTVAAVGARAVVIQSDETGEVQVWIPLGRDRFDRIQ